MKHNPRFILSKSTVIMQYSKLKDIADITSYSYKTNKYVGNILKKTDSMFSVHSIQSIDELKCPERIWYFAQAWNKKEIRELLERGINNFVVDNKNDLDILDEFLNKKINLLLRMRLEEHTIHTGKHFVYGMYSKEINELLPLLKKKLTNLGFTFIEKPRISANGP